MSGQVITVTRADSCESEVDAAATELAFDAYLAARAERDEHISGSVVRDGLVVTLTETWRQA